MSLKLKGIFSIPASPFNDRGELDLHFLRRQVEFSITSGAAAIIGPVIASEVWYLSNDERKQFMDAITDQTARRIPVIAGVSSNTIEETIDLASHAAASGADAVIAMLPKVEMTADWEQTHSFYARLADATGLEIVIQNGGRGPEDRIPIANLMRLMEKIDQIRYIKDEGLPSNHRVTELVHAGGDRLHGVFGGMGGRYMIDEMRRGACGFAPISTFTDVLVKIWDNFHAGNETLAVDMHEKLATMLNIELQVGTAFAKELLRRRGLVGTGRSRMGQVEVDEFDLAEMDLRLARLKPYFNPVTPEQLDAAVARRAR
jgi:4-hydroxy-tetrahydrodipicolinate synthase